MDIIKASLNKPVVVLVGILLAVLFGVISLYRLPYQLSPTVVEPEITVTTTWRGASPYEIEREIIEEQENALKGLPGLVQMESSSTNSRGQITLKFKIGTDLNAALLLVTNKLGEVSSYPENADRPAISSAGQSASPVVWVLLRAMEGNDREVATYRTYFDNEVRQYLERVEGVADLYVSAGTPEEMHILVRHRKLAAHGLMATDVIRALRVENVNISAGTMGVGRRDYRVRTLAEFRTPEEIEQVVITSTGQERVTVGDVAEVRRGYAKPNGIGLNNDKGTIAIGIRPEAGENVLSLTERAEKAVQWLNEYKLKPEGLYLEWVYDQRFYINGAIDLIKQNILLGGVLAVAVLLIFLRSVRATLVVATAIPVSVVTTFVFMDLMGRNLNVVSLAGIAFAVGMLVDNSIVVIENIDRHRKMGKRGYQAALDGTREVWGAVFASTLTTVAVFLPVVFIQEEAGQLFRDIAIAVVASVSLSLFVSVTVIPMVAERLFRDIEHKEPQAPSAAARVGGGLIGAIMGVVGLAVRNWFTRLVTVCLLVTIAVGTVKVLTPKMEYLPQGNRNFVMSIMVPPPGLSNEERLEIGHDLFAKAGPHIGQEKDGLPAIKSMFYIARDTIMLVGAMAEEWDRAGELVPFFRGLIYSTPGMFGISNQVGIFQRGLGKGRNVDIDVSGDDLSQIIAASGALFGKTRGVLAGAQVRPVPSIEMTYPEVQFIPRRDRLRANRMSATDLGVTVDVLMDGRVVGDFKEEGKRKIDLILKAYDEEVSTPEALSDALVSTPGGLVVPISSLAEIRQTTGLQQIRHLERSRTVTLQVTPPGDMPLEVAMEKLEGEVIGPLRDAGKLEGLEVRLSGAASKLRQTREALQWNFLLAAIIAYLLMASLFDNFFYPMIIMLTVPLAGAGGFLGLKLLNLFLVPQPMDILTMLGFVILIGVVVNNAILIVHQALNNLHQGGMDYREAVLESTRSRLRPIFMSATTSIFGMLPLVLFHGAGSELYRGLGSVLLGGLAVSTVFTILIIPSILMFVIRMEKPRVRPAERGEVAL